MAPTKTDQAEANKKKRDRKEERRLRRIKEQKKICSDEQERLRASFVKWIKDRMSEKGISRSALARTIKKTRAHVVHVLDRKGNMSLRTMVQFAEACDLEVSIVLYAKTSLPGI